MNTADNDLFKRNTEIFKNSFLTGKITQSSIMMESKIEKIIVLLFSLITRELISIGSKHL